MHLVDTTMFFCARSGGVKRYLSAKHEWLSKHVPAVRHSLLVPASPRIASGVVQFKGACLPLVDGYRFPLSRRSWRDHLIALQPDLIEAGDVYVPGRAAQDAATHLRIPIVAFCHSDVQRLFAERVGEWTRSLTRRWVHSFYSGIDLVLAPSRAMVSSLADAGITDVVHQPLGVDTHIFHPKCRRADFKRELGIKDSTRLLVYAGRFAKEKNLPVLMEVAEQLGSSYHLLLIGGRRRHAYRKNVTVWPYQRNAEMLATLVASCDAFVHAGEHETFGLVLAEAMACGLPIVAVDSGGIPEVANHDVGVLVRRATVKELCAGVQGLFERDVEMLARKARLRAEQAFSWDATFGPLMSIYLRLTNAQPVTAQVHAPATA